MLSSTKNCLKAHAILFGKQYVTLWIKNRRALFSHTMKPLQNVARIYTYTLTISSGCPVDTA